MITTVIKRNGAREAFNEDKLKKSVMAAAKDANIQDERIRELVIGVSEKIMNNFEKKDEVMTSEIRDSVLAELDRMEPVVADAWRRFESMK